MTAATEPEVRDPEIPFVPRNFWAWVAYQFFYRIGWQFKMEATMVAGLVSFLSPSASVMGLFTTVSNLGRYAGPFWATGLIDASPRKKSCLPTTTGEASIGSSSRLTASTSSLSLRLMTTVVPSRPVK